MADDATLLDDLITRARKQGADAADALIVHSVGISHAQRLGKIEKLEREESQDLGLRVLIGKKQAMVSSTDFDAGTLDELVDRAISMARTVPDDPYCGLAEPEQLATTIPDLDIADLAEPSADTLVERARACEDTARAVTGITNSEGAEAGWSLSRIRLAASNGFTGGYDLSQHAISTEVIAGEGTGMEGDYDYSISVHGEDLDSSEEVGRRAGDRAVRRLNPRRPATGQVPIIFDPRVAGSLVRHCIGAISGTAIARGTSFLKDHLDKAVFKSNITIVDDPHRRRGLRSKPFDGEGLANSKRSLIDKGVLTTWLLDLASARQLGLQSTGHAARGTSGPPGPSATNLYLEPGTLSPEELMSDITSGLYLTDLLGMGVNQITGDYSRGAAGYWIENGKPAYPVSELTIAGNLKDMFMQLTPASDLVFRFGTDAPTLRVDGMTVASSG